MDEQRNYFAELAAIDVSEHIEKKGKFSYLSWSWAVAQLRKHYPDATWEVCRFDGLPYLKTECGYFVEVAVTVNGITLSQIHPIMDNFNKPIEKPNARHVNDSIMRCLVKAIALHGLGLYIYAGEDLPYSDEEREEKQKAQEHSEPSHTLKAKYQLGTGSMDGFEQWVEKMRGKGMNCKQMEHILTEGLMKKQQEEEEAAKKQKKAAVAGV